MTFFQPEQKSFINYIIGGLIAVSLSASVIVILLYNGSVNLQHEISAAELNIRKLQTDKAQLQEKIFAVLNGVDPRNFSGGRNLVEEKNPEYFKTGGNGAVSLVTQ